MDTEKLRAFVVLAEVLNFRKSAEILHMSQPPLSRLIAGLEDDLKVQLFERTTRSVSLTGAGIVMLEEARLVLASMEQLKENVRKAELAKDGRGSLRVGFSATAFLARLPVILEEFQALYPKIRVELRQEASKTVLKELVSGKIDVGFVEAISSAKGLMKTAVSEEVLGALVRKNHRLAKRKEIEFSDLSQETLILHHKKEAEEFHKNIAHLIQGLEEKPKVYIKAQHEICPILVATGKGIALTIAGAQRVAIDGTRFVPIRDMFLPVSAFWSEENDNPSLARFLTAIRENKSLRHSPLHCLSLSQGSMISK